MGAWSRRTEQSPGRFWSLEGLLYMRRRGNVSLCVARPSLHLLLSVPGTPQNYLISSFPDQPKASSSSGVPSSPRPTRLPRCACCYTALPAANLSSLLMCWLSTAPAMVFTSHLWMGWCYRGVVKLCGCLKQSNHKENLLRCILTQLLACPSQGDQCSPRVRWCWTEGQTA